MQKWFHALLTLSQFDACEYFRHFCPLEKYKVAFPKIIYAYCSKRFEVHLVFAWPPVLCPSILGLSYLNLFAINILPFVLRNSLNEKVNFFAVYQQSYNAFLFYLQLWCNYSPMLRVNKINLLQDY